MPIHWLVIKEKAIAKLVLLYLDWLISNYSIYGRGPTVGIIDALQQKYSLLVLLLKLDLYRSSYYQKKIKKCIDK